MMLRQRWDWLTIILFSFVACVGLLPEGMPWGHDLSYELVRVAEYVNTLKTGGLPARWAVDLAGGYGEPIFNFFPPLFLSVAAGLVLLGAAIVTAVKIAILIFTMAGGVGMYLFAGKFYGRGGSLLAACLYIGAPYHLFGIYTRNAYSEYAAGAVAPYVFWAITRIRQENKGIGVNGALLAPLAVSGGLFAISHNLSLLIYTPLFVLYYLFGMALTRDWRSLPTMAVGVFLVFCLAAFYLLPIFAEKEFIQLWQLTIGNFDVFQNFISLNSLFRDGGSRAPVLLSLIILASAAAALICQWRHMGRLVRAILGLFWVFLFGLLFLLTPASLFVWKSLPVMALLQFPWRLLSPATFVLCFLAGSIAFLPRGRLADDFVPRRLIPTVLLLFFGLAPVVLHRAAKSADYLVVDDADLAPFRISRLNLRATVLNEYRPRWAPSQLAPSAPGSRLTVCEQERQARGKAPGALGWEYRLSLPQTCQAQANIHYFPGWTILDNGRVLPSRITSRGLMSFDLGPGEHLVQLVFRDTAARGAGNLLSGLGLLVLFGLLGQELKPAKARPGD
jgi:hypothetical protein